MEVQPHASVNLMKAAINLHYTQLFSSYLTENCMLHS